jgi:tetratricopeptide (TPR) repeat protein
VTTSSASHDLTAAFKALYLEPEVSEASLRQVLAQGEDGGAALMLATALRLQGRYGEARDIALPLTKAHPRWFGALFELGLAQAGLGENEEALRLLLAAQTLGGAPGLWRALGDAHWALGQREAAESAYLRHLAAPALEPLLQAAVAAEREARLDEAERLLSLQLQRHPGDVLALRILAEILSAAERYEESEELLRRCLERAPSFALARYGLAMVLLHDHRLPPARNEADALLSREPNRAEYLYLKADVLARMGDSAGAAQSWSAVLKIRADDPTAWTNLGHVLRTLGRRSDCEDAYRRAIELNPAMGDAYWGLANLKTFRFGPDEIAAMRSAAPHANGQNQAALLFALGKALEDEGDDGGAFSAYEAANAAHRQTHPYDPAERAEDLRRAREVYTKAFFDARAGSGALARDPIFVVGMPRSGSTLVEQILSSHSEVEGTMELIELLAMARKLGREGRFPELLRDMTPARARELGEDYLARTRAFRKTDAPNFVDKMPNNFTQIGLIQCILPNARIIDVRRHPLACCFSIFKQHWATGQAFAYSLEDIGAFYRNYVSLMGHFDQTLPGRVYRVNYERLVADTEGEVRRLLDACGLTFEERCLRFYETERTVVTPSSEQVRMPIFATGNDVWRRFEPWLQPLKRALGPVLDAYPDAPPL